jgi:predicted NBD/HSP70 family sugar kinase
MTMYVLFDIGKTNMRIAASADCKELTAEPVKADVPDNYTEMLDVVADLVHQQCGDEPVIMAGGGIGGPLDKEKRHLVTIPDANKQVWVGKPLQDDLAAAIGAPVILENDSAIVGLGEAHFGGGKTSGVMAYMTVSTGVGGARIVDGGIDTSTLGFEPGHQIIDIDHSLCSSCESNTLEDYVSGTATERRYGVKPYEVEPRDAWDEIAYWLAVGIANTIVHWSPERIVLGGSMVVKKPGIYVSDVQRHLHETLTIFPPEHHPVLVEATCGDFGGLYGALVFVNNNRDPGTA